MSQRYDSESVIKKNKIPVDQLHIYTGAFPNFGLMVKKKFITNGSQDINISKPKREGILNILYHQNIH